MVLSSEGCSDSWGVGNRKKCPAKFGKLLSLLESCFDLILLLLFESPLWMVKICPVSVHFKFFLFLTIFEYLVLQTFSTYFNQFLNNKTR